MKTQLAEMRDKFKHDQKSAKLFPSNHLKKLDIVLSKSPIESKADGDAEIDLLNLEAKLKLNNEKIKILKSDSISCFPICWTTSRMS